MNQPVEPRRRKARWTPASALIVSALLIAFFLWHAVFYDGFFKWLGEWQFGTLRFYFPAVTLAILTVICMIPLLLVLLAVRLIRRRRRRVPSAIARTIGWSAGTVWLFYGVAAMAAVGAVVTLILMLMLPQSNTPSVIVLGTPSAVSPPDGPAELRGAIDYRRTARFGQGQPLFRREILIAPIAAEDQGETPLRYFVQVPSIGPTYRRTAAVATGYLAHNRLPRELAQLYRNVGISLAEDNYILYPSRQSVRMPFLLTAIQLALLALVSLIFGASQHLRHRRLVRRLRPPVEEVPPPVEDAAPAPAPAMAPTAPVSA